MSRDSTGRTGAPGPTDPAGGSSTALSGTVERIVFQNQDTHWTVAKVLAEGNQREVTAVGSLLGLTPGTTVTLYGNWARDPRFGLQFRVDSYITRAPESLVGIERYLGSGLVPGVGPELARRIVERFGLETLEVINTDPRRLREVEGIGPARAERIAEAWVDQRDVQNVMVFLRGHGISTAYAARIFKRYGKEAVAVLRANPYRLCTDVWGIGFKSADRIARSLGLAPDAPERLEAGLVHVLGELGSDGHLHAPRTELVERAAALLEVEAERLGLPLDRLLGSRVLIEESLGERGRCVSLAEMWADEHEAAQAAAHIAGTHIAAIELDVRRALVHFERLTDIQLAPQQRRAIEAATRDKFVVITGGPGVGKTTIVRAILTLAGVEGRKTALAAPTGRAAKRLQEATGAPAQTLHRLLAFQPQSGDFERNAQDPIDADVVIVDEASMIDTPLFRALMVATRPATQVVLVGDIDQLPSVGPGQVLADIIRSGAATVVELTEIFRQAAKSSIVINAHRVNHGQPLLLDGAESGETSDFFFIARNDPQSARETLVELVAERIPRRFGFDPMREVQVLTPMHRGDLGTTALNAALQERLNPGGEGAREVARGERAFRVGDKVMQVRNNYDKEIFNGDVGVIADLRERGRELVFEAADGRRAIYERDELDQLVHAYAISVHKAQGSEYPAVVLPLVTQHYMMLQRNLLYTAITRGKRLVVLIGSRRAVSMAVRNDSTRTRWTWLAERIRAAMASG